MIFMHYIVGLGNPGEEYKLSRHNTGRIVLAGLAKPEDMEKNKKLNALVEEIKIKKEKALVIFPETFMNKSGDSLKSLITSKKKAENLVVVHDDLDLPLGRFKISFASGSAGHKGVESVMRAIKTRDFIRIRAGISPATPSGKIKKPSGKKAGDFILADFTPKELSVVKKNAKKIASAVETVIGEGKEKAMSLFN
jgi:PTH1 family peptidyl-tRNA hydrolase